MDAATADQWELFPNIAEKTKPKSRFREYMDAIEKHGALMTPTMAAVGLGLHRSRVHQLLNEGRLASVRVGEERLIPAAALEVFLTEERRAGRPIKEPTLREAVSSALKNSRK